MTIKELQTMIIQFRDARDWGQFNNPKDSSISLVLEATEVLEHFQWKNKEEMESHIRDKNVEVGEELADALYWVLLLAQDLDVDIEKAFTEKMAKNEAKYPINKVKGTHKKYTELN